MKTITTIRPILCSSDLKHTETRCEDVDVEVGGENLHFCREHATAGYDVARQADTNNLQDRFEDEHSEMR